MDIKGIPEISWEDLCIGEIYYCLDGSTVYCGYEPESYPYLVEIMDNGKDIEGNEYIYVTRLDKKHGFLSGYYIYSDDYGRYYKLRYKL